MSLRNLVYFLFISIGFGSCDVTSKEKPIVEKTDFELKVRNYLKANAQNNRFNGTVLIAQKDSILAEENMGFAVHKSNTLFSDTSVFLIGSITKTFTSAAVLQLVETKGLSLNDKLSKYFADFPRAQEVSIRQLLTHTSGIRDYHEFEDWKKESQRKSLVPEDVVNTVKQDPFRYEPEERFYYSNTGYILLGLIIEQVSGLNFSTYINKNICTPLQLNNTGVCDNNSLPTNLVKGYRTNPTGIYNAEWINYNQPFSSGNMYSNLGDLERFTEAVFGGELFSKDLLSLLMVDNFGKYGYGWGIRNVDSLTFYGHVGAMNGFVGGINYLPQQGLFIGFLTNDDNTPRYTLSNELTKMSLGYPIEQPKPRKYFTLNPEKLKPFLGSYLIKKGDTLQVYSINKKLFLKETGQMEHELFCFEDGVFDLEQLEFDVVFSSSAKNEFEYLSFRKNEQEFIQAVRIK